MKPEQKLAILCAYCDLVGALQAREQFDIEVHDWKAHRTSIEEIEKVFPFVKDHYSTYRSPKQKRKTK